MDGSIATTTPTSLARDAAARLGWSIEVLDDCGYLFELRRPDGARKVLIGGRSALNDAVAARLAEDKHYAGVLMAREGLAVPRTARCMAEAHLLGQRYPTHAGYAPAHALAEACGYPLVVKPNALSHGRGVVLVEDETELEAAIDECWELGPIALAQERIEGTDFRFDFLDGDYLLGYERRPIRVVGDGASTIGALIGALDPRFATEQALLSSWRVAEVFAANDWRWDGVLAAGEVLDLDSPIRNLNAGCTATLLPAIGDALRAHCLRAARALGLRHFGVDLKLPSLAADPADAVFIEINASPLLVSIARLGHHEAAVAAEARVLRATLP
ncbi:MAG: hypothetical protein KF729_33190 [Sandaracinaceae bacterium]|nr:hypothetical protein [Sandaracinaceae bacterium]